MSLRINTNVTAMNAYRNVGATSDAYSQSIQRLSTGLRINSAADDPAGLIISETFRAQIAGIDQAIRNNQDAVNYAKTAEGALDEVNKLLTDARSLAVASGNTGTLSASQIQANQSQLNSIVTSISRIAATTNFGGKKLLDGSAGVSAAVTDGSKFAAMSFSGNFNGVALTTTAAVTVNVTQAATKGAVTGTQAYAGLTSLVAAGSFSINGTTFTTNGTETLDTVLTRLNAATAQTGVTASFNGTNVVLTATKYGSTGSVAVADATGGILLTAAGFASNSGVDAVATVSVDTDGTGPGGAVNVTFTGGRMGMDAFVLSDNYGNRITLTDGGNNAATGPTQAGQLIVGSAMFQIGGNVGETVIMSLGNMDSTLLGAGVVAGKNLSNLDLTTATGANDAMKVIDAAINEVAGKRGDIGSFQRNTLESNIRSLGVAKENLSATQSTIRDTDVAQEMTNFTKLQILQQAGMAMLAQANAAPQSVLSLLRG